MNAPLVLAITGASGAPYAVRLLQVLAQCDVDVHLTISGSGAAVIQQELGLKLNLNEPDITQLVTAQFPWASNSNGKETAPPGTENLTNRGKSDATREFINNRLHYHHYSNFLSPIASGSHLTSGMIICPCSGSTLAAVAHAQAGNLVQRAAEVHLKERRKLVIVPRESPISSLQIENMHRVSLAGGVVLPAMPGWYHGVQSIDDLINFVVARILDQFGLGEGLMRRWGSQS